jgi:hypothetical protein
MDQPHVMGETIRSLYWIGHINNRRTGYVTEKTHSPTGPNDTRQSDLGKSGFRLALSITWCRRTGVAEFTPTGACRYKFASFDSIGRDWYLAYPANSESPFALYKEGKVSCAGNNQ